MAARQVPQYTEGQLAREIARLETKPFFPRTEANVESFRYYEELLTEDSRRAPLRVEEAGRFRAWVDSARNVA
jgi:hypothetical protein